ncbi:MAG: putative Ig domain-containing protein [Nanoarchaeota archaeon]
MKKLKIRLNKHKLLIHKYEVDIPISILALVTSLVFAMALSFVTSPDVTPNSPSKADNLVCNWNASIDMVSQNVSWYNGSLSFRNDTNQTPPSVVLSNFLSRGEVWNCTIRIGNSTHLAEASDRVTIGNAPPTTPQVLNETGSNLGINFQILEDTNRTLNFTATDSDGDILTFSATSLPTGSTFNTSTGQFKWGMDDAQVGQYNITFIALDNQSSPGSVAITVNLTVTEINDNPYFSPDLANQTATQGSYFSYTITGADEENNIPFNVTFSGGPSNLIILNTSNTTYNLSFKNAGTPQKADVGNYTVNLTINDSRSGTNTSSINLEVRGTNTAPILSFIENQTGTQNALFTLFINATDVDNDTLNFSIRSVNCILSNPWIIRNFNQSMNSTNATIAYGVINNTMNNSNGVCKLVNISVSDGSQNAWQQIKINITNVNDAPVINEPSHFQENTFNNTNFTYIRAASNQTLVFRVNATDIDQLTEDGDTLNYSDNTSLFDINQTGAITWIPNSSYLGNNTFRINVTDQSGLSVNRTMIIDVRNNTAPTLNSIGNKTCAEDVLCTIFFTGSDIDGDTLTFISNNTNVVNIVFFNSSAALLNFTPTQSQVGNYSITITVKDIFNANVSESFTFSINNTNDDPVLGAINLTYPPIVVNKTTYREINASDEDFFLLGNTENLTFDVSFNTTQIPFNFTTIFNSSTNESIGILNITPTTANISRYRINISVKDRAGRVAWRQYDFDILNQTQKPNITMIRPYGAPLNTTTTIHAFINTSNFNSSITNITLQENTSTLFNISATDDFTSLSDFKFYWYVNSTLVNQNQSANRTYGIFSAGQENVTLFVEDSTLENSTWTWIVTINNTNRVPQLKNNLDNLSVSGTTTYYSYLYQRSNIKYIDPDDDENSDGEISGNETNRLSFNVTTCDKATLTISGTDLVVTSSAVGTCNIVFTAYDSGGLSNISNPVTINISSLSSSTTTTTTTTTTITSSGGGGGGGTSIIPTRREIKHPFNLILPQIVSYIENNTVYVPIKLNNSMGMDIYGINFSAKTNESGVMFRFVPPRMNVVKDGQLNETILEVSNFTFGKNFGVEVTARSEVPALEDSSQLLIVSEGTVKYAEEVKTRISVAESLLKENLECRELNELLDRAKDDSRRFKYQEALKYVDAAINGCKYLIAKTQKKVEQPKSITFEYTDPVKSFYISSILLLIILVGAAVSWEFKLRKTSKLQKIEAEALRIQRFFKK